MTKPIQGSYEDFELIYSAKRLTGACMVTGVYFRGNKYKISMDDSNPGDLVYNPLSNVIMYVDEEDDFDYVNTLYYKLVKEKRIFLKSLKKYKVTALVTTAYSTTIEASSQEEAWKIAQGLSEGEFEECIGFKNSDWRIHEVCLEEPEEEKDK